MQLRTYTGLWNVEKRLYKFYDINLPYPVSLRQLGIFASVSIPWAILMSLVHVPFAPPFGHLIWIAPPIAAAIYANRPIAEGKTLTDFGLSQIRFYLSSRVFHRLAPEQTHRYGTPVTVTARVWTRTPDD